MNDKLASKVVEQNPDDIKAAVVIYVDKKGKLGFHHHEMSFEQILRNMTILKKYILKELSK